MTVPLEYYGPTNYVCTGNGRIDRGMDFGLHKESPMTHQHHDILNISKKHFIHLSTDEICNERNNNI